MRKLWGGIEDIELCKLVKGFKDISGIDFNRMTLKCLLKRLRDMAERELCHKEVN